MTIIGWITWGSVRGLGVQRASQVRADQDRQRDQVACNHQGGYSDRQVYGITPDGWVLDATTGEHVWPHGRTNRALRVTPAPFLGKPVGEIEVKAP